MSSKTKGVFLEYSEYAILGARTSGLEPPFTVEALAECPVGAEPREVAAFVGELSGARAGRYTQSVCGVYPSKRFVRRAMLENPVKARDPQFIDNFLQQQYRIAPDEYLVVPLGAGSGQVLNFEKSPPKEVLFAGAPMAELDALQELLTDCLVYPARLEIGSIATIGGLLSYGRFAQTSAPTLALELSEEHAHIYILRDGVVDVARPIPLGLKSMFPVVQKELGLKDEESARKLFFSDTFDFTEMAPLLLKTVQKEVEASTGFYEVQTGQTIGNLFLGLLPRNLGWVASSLSRSLKVSPIMPEVRPWLESMGIEVSAEVELGNRGARWFGLFSLMGNFQPAAPQAGARAGKQATTSANA